MRLDRAVGQDKSPDLRASSEAPQPKVPENELENRIINLDKLTDALSSALKLAVNQPPASSEFHAIDLVSDLRLKVKASQQMFQLARLLEEPARTDVLSTVTVSIENLEAIIALEFGVELK